jgi:hypothetical protein
MKTPSPVRLSNQEGAPSARRANFVDYIQRSSGVALALLITTAVANCVLGYFAVNRNRNGPTESQVSFTAGSSERKTVATNVSDDFGILRADLNNVVVALQRIQKRLDEKDGRFYQPAPR